jgi:hypothetical protein
MIRNRGGTATMPLFHRKPVFRPQFAAIPRSIMVMTGFRPRQKVIEALPPYPRPFFPIGERCTGRAGAVRLHERPAIRRGSCWGGRLAETAAIGDAILDRRLRIGIRISAVPKTPTARGHLMIHQSVRGLATGSCAGARAGPCVHVRGCWTKPRPWIGFNACGSDDGGNAGDASNDDGGPSWHWRQVRWTSSAPT